MAATKKTTNKQTNKGGRPPKKPSHRTVSDKLKDVIIEINQVEGVETDLGLKRLSKEIERINRKFEARYDIDRSK